MARAGATAIEIGMPFSDPAADGPVIQRACERALNRGVKLKDVIEVAGRAVEASGVPIVLFSYLNPLLRHGLENVAQDAAEAGLAGVLVTDLPAESAQGFSQALQRRGLDLVSLVAPTSTEQRIAQIAQHATGFLYAISVAGVTGTRQQLSADVSGLLAAHPARHRSAGRGWIRHQQRGAGARGLGAGRRRGDRRIGDCQKD